MAWAQKPVPVCRDWFVGRFIRLSDRGRLCALLGHVVAAEIQKIHCIVAHAINRVFVKTVPNRVLTFAAPQLVGRLITDKLLPVDWLEIGIVSLDLGVTALQGVIADATVESVAARFSDENVFAGVADEEIVAVAAPEDIIVGPAEEVV